MNNLRIKAALALFALASVIAMPAPAQAAEWYLSPAAVYYDDDPDRAIDDGVSGFQLTLGRAVGENFALEGILSFADLDGFYETTSGVVRSSESQMAFGIRALAFYDRDARLTPYLALGAGQLSQDYDVGGTDNNPLFSLGGGLKWQLGQSPVALNAELRLRYVDDGGGRTFNDFIGTVGLAFGFGTSSGPKTVSAKDLRKDSDGDGVPDYLDECPKTPAGVEVTAKGCPAEDLTRDTDGDRVPDYLDQCPETPTGAPVDDNGCSLDSDMDGVLSGDDLCPASRPGADVDEFGCEADNDGDGVVNHRDECANTRAGVRVDVKGCEIRDVISLPGVNFDTGSDRLLAGFEDLIVYAAETLKKYPELRIEVAGHTDDVGDATMNQGLSDRRAKTVMDHLIRYGVDPTRLSYRGYGESRPIANNTTKEGRAQNRRVELRVVR